MNQKNTSLLERLFEGLLWKSRLIVLLPVIFAIFAAFALFITGSIEIFTTAKHLIINVHHEIDYEHLLIGVIGAIDLFLIAIVLLIFAFGIYEIFISKIDIARSASGEHNVLEITSLDELKNKLLKVIIMVLIVTFFKTILTTTFSTPLEMLYFALAILAVASCYFFLSQDKHK